MDTQEQNCKLCGQMRPLCKSHIVPKFAYAPIKNAENQIYKIRHKVKKVTPITRDDISKKVQKSYSEKLLCQKCETLISDYENKFKKLWMNTIIPVFNHLSTRPFDVIPVEVSDYDAFKLFHMSVFWRAAVSKFKCESSISFGCYEDEIATLLREGNPGEPGDFLFLGTLILDENGHLAEPMVTSLAKGRFEGHDGHDCYMMNYAFCDWIFVLARPGSQWMVNLEIQCREKGEFLLFTLPYTQSKSFNLSVDILRHLRQ